MTQVRIYLAWQRIADGRTQIRRWSPDREYRGNHYFLGYEKQTPQSLAWLQANGEPTWPECLSAALPSESYCVSNNGDVLKAWGTMKTLKVNGGEG